MADADSKRKAGARRQRGDSLRSMLLVAFFLVAVIPVGLLAFWTQRSAYEKELDEVSERHLLLAKNLSHALDRYARDVEAVFQLSIAAMDGGTTIDGGVARLLVEMGFEHDCIVDETGRPISIILNIEDREGYYTPAEMSELQAAAKAADGDVVFTGVRANWAGQPKLVVVRQLDDGRTALGVLGMNYLLRLQKEIAFGERGHSAIVDQFGRVLAHPNESWRLEMKDISAILPVARMVAGETGVETFYSPAMEADMIAGFTSVDRTGWGVMVPQPIRELERHANQVQMASLLIGALGLLVALALAWVLARHLARPIETVAAVAREVEGGNAEARVDGLPQPTPREIRSLSEAFNRMLGEMQQSGEQLRIKAYEADQASRAKSRFLANMSHELRTPLSAIIGFADIMADRLLGPVGHDGAYDEHARAIRDAGRHLLQLVDQILLLTRSEAGQLELHLEDTDVAESIGFAIAMVAPMAKDRGVELVDETAGTLPALWSDSGKLRQVIINLLSNAVKFTEAGGRVRVKAAPGGGDWPVEISIADTGIGIASDDMEKVLSPFGQAADSYDRRHGGMGLGLPLTRELVALLGGEFELRSRPGEGTVALVRLPLTVPTDTAGDGRAASSAAG
ncbi:MAG: hypothetical protein TEF_14780 [Rhizobiales bacterium NRL2]|jgi:signal transduction histidine kinase|nr:MAG: hypothetical protein TEF_14780 [Rhizobiales bacterium NRL2]